MMMNINDDNDRDNVHEVLEYQYLIDSGYRVSIKEHLFTYLGLFLFCLCQIGSYYTYDLPGAFGAHELSKWYGIDETRYGLLYSVYGFPNIVMVIIGGFLVDRYIGLRGGLLLFSGLVTLGNILFAISASYHLFWLAILGRLIYGIGGESFYVVIFTFVSKWFFGRNDCTLAFALTTTVGKVAGAIDLNLTSIISDKSNLPYAMWFGALLCSFCFLISLGIIYMETLKLKKDQNPGIESILQEKPKISDILKFPISYWILVLFAVLFLIPILSYITISKDFLQSYFPTINIGFILSFPYYLSGLSPIFGFIIDRVGRNLIFLAISVFLCALSFFILGFVKIQPILGLSLLGISLGISLSTSMVMINPLIPPKNMALAFAIYSSCINATCSTSFILINYVLEKTKDNYSIIIIIFLILLGLSGVLVTILMILDKKQQLLNVSPQLLRQKMKEKEEKL